MIIVKVENLVKIYGNGVKALDNLTYQVREGEIFGLLGPNGSGKTTSINCVLGLLKYDQGTVEVFGEPMTPTSYNIKKNIGIVTQDVAVFEELTVYENVDYFCGLYVKDAKERKTLVEEALNFVSINDFRNFYPKKLSGGLLRRLHIACGIAHKPKLIIMDEPTVGIDPQSRNNILEGIKKLNKEGATIIYTSHYMEEVEQICDYILIIDKGKTVAEGSKEELKALISLGEVIEVETENVKESTLDAIKKLDNVISVELKHKAMIIKLGKGKSNIPEVLKVLDENEQGYTSIYSELPTLNDVFLELTGKELRD